MSGDPIYSARGDAHLGFVTCRRRGCRQTLARRANVFWLCIALLVLAGGHTGTLRGGMIEHAICAKPSVGDAQGVRIDPPDLDAQPLRRPSGRHIDRVNGNAACHRVPPMSAKPW